MELAIPAQPEPVILDTARTGLIVVDMQNAFCKPGGMFDIMGTLEEEKVKPVITADKKVIEACRGKGIKVIYLRMTYRPDLSNAGGQDSPNYWKEGGMKAMRLKPEFKDSFLIDGTWGWQIIGELAPAPGDIAVNKNRFSGFTYTELDAILRTLNIRHLIFIGIFSNICVESTIRDAFFHEYFPVMVGDACGNRGPGFTQEATIYNISHAFGWVTTSGELIAALQKAV